MSSPANPIRKPPRPFLGSVRADELIILDEVKRRLKWGDKTVSRAQRDGLKVIHWGRQAYVLGADLLEFFRGLPRQSASVGDAQKTRGNRRLTEAAEPEALPEGRTE